MINETTEVISGGHVGRGGPAGPASREDFCGFQQDLGNGIIHVYECFCRVKGCHVACMDYGNT